MQKRNYRWIGLIAALAVVLSACGANTGGTKATDPQGTPTDWSSVIGQAKGQIVNWHMYGGDDTLNAFVAGYVTDEMKKLGVKVNQVKVTDTADAINTMLGEKQAGKTTGGSVDLVWVNGENFASGKQADLWSCGFDKVLPNSKYVDFSNPTVKNDFGVPVQGCAAVWQQANSALVYDSSKLSASDVVSMESLFEWVTAHPGQFTYPAPPDFTGSMAVRTMLYDTISGPESLPVDFDQTKYDEAVKSLWPRINSIESSLWHEGNYPQSQEEVEKLYANGEIAAFFTYGPGSVGDKVAKETFPASTRQAVLSAGNIANTSFVAIPANAAHREAALLLANLLEDPQTQLALYKAEGIYPGIDLTTTDPATQRAFADVPLKASVLPLSDLTKHAQPELASAYVSQIEKDWKTEVARK